MAGRPFDAESPIPDHDEPVARPFGRDAVREALIEATIECIMEEGLGVSVRRIAERAGVNHGLVHAYFENKQGLLSAAIDAINERASHELDDDGYPPPDLASRRGGELARAIARIQLDSGKDLGSSNPISSAWKTALSTSRPDLTAEEIDTKVATASALGLGWALFADHLGDLLGVDAEQRLALDAHVSSVIADLGGLPWPPPDMAED